MCISAAHICKVLGVNWDKELSMKESIGRIMDLTNVVVCLIELCSLSGRGSIQKNH